MEINHPQLNHRSFAKDYGSTYNRNVRDLAYGFVLLGMNSQDALKKALDIFRSNQLHSQFTTCKSTTGYGVVLISALTTKGLEQILSYYERRPWPSYEPWPYETIENIITTIGEPFIMCPYLSGSYNYNRSSIGIHSNSDKTMVFVAELNHLPTQNPKRELFNQVADIIAKNLEHYSAKIPHASSLSMRDEKIFINSLRERPMLFANDFPPTLGKLYNIGQTMDTNRISIAHIHIIESLLM